MRRLPRGVSRMAVSERHAGLFLPSSLPFPLFLPVVDNKKGNEARIHDRKEKEKPFDRLPIFLGDSHYIPQARLSTREKISLFPILKK